MVWPADGGCMDAAPDCVAEAGGRAPGDLGMSNAAMRGSDTGGSHLGLWSQCCDGDSGFTLPVEVLRSRWPGSGWTCAEAEVEVQQPVGLRFPFSNQWL